MNVKMKFYYKLLTIINSGGISMNWDAMKEDLKQVKKANEEFYEKYGEEFVKILRDEQADAEGCLKQELLFELLDHVQGLCHMADYLDKKVAKEGKLSRSENGEILFNGERLPLMKEIEVYVYEENCRHEVWTVTYVCGVEKPYLAGLNKEMEINGIPARIRE